MPIITKSRLKQIVREALEETFDEAAYPSSWNLEEFTNINSFAGRLRYCKEHLQPIAQGSGRYVFGIDNETVLKLAKNRKGIAQNEAEYNIANDGYDQIVAEVFECDEDYLWIEMERMNKCTPRTFESATGIKFDIFADALMFEENRVRGRRRMGIPSKPPEMDELYENEFFTHVVDSMVGYDLMVGDLIRIGSWGINTSGDVKLIDAGFTEDVNKNHYYRAI
jgi:hypothetical protein